MYYLHTLRDRSVGYDEGDQKTQNKVRSIYKDTCACVERHLGEGEHYHDLEKNPFYQEMRFEKGNSKVVVSERWNVLVKGQDGIEEYSGGIGVAVDSLTPGLVIMITSIVDKGFKCIDDLAASQD